MYKFFLGGGIVFGQILATSAKITPNRGLVREFPQNTLNSGRVVLLPSGRGAALTGRNRTLN